MRRLISRDFFGIPAGGVLRGRRFVFCEAAKKERKKRLLEVARSPAQFVGKNLIQSSSFLSATFCFASPQAKQDAAGRLVSF